MKSKRWGRGWGREDCDYSVSCQNLFAGQIKFPRFFSPELKGVLICTTGEISFYVDGKRINSRSSSCGKRNIIIPKRTRVVTFRTRSTFPGIQRGVLASFGEGALVTDESWKCTNAVKTGWKAPDYSNQDWPSAVVFCNNTAPISPMTHIQGIAGPAEWIWVGNQNATTIYCRRIL